jgi:cytochrome c oxidase cbb3-type subunit 1
MYPYYIARAFGGLLFLIGTVVCCYNIWMTVRSVQLAERRDSDVPSAVAVPGE